MVLSSVAFNKPLRLLKKTFDGWIRIWIKSEYGCKRKSRNCCDLFLAKVFWFIISKILFNMNIFKLKMVIWPPLKIFSYFASLDHVWEKFVSKICCCRGSVWQVLPCSINPSAQLLATEKPRGFFSFCNSCFSPATCKSLCLLCPSVISVSAELNTVAYCEANALIISQSGKWLCSSPAVYPSRSTCPLLSWLHAWVLSCRVRLTRNLCSLGFTTRQL